VNDATENIGARRLHTVMERLLDQISFEGPDLRPNVVTIDDAYVTNRCTPEQVRRLLGQFAASTSSRNRTAEAIAGSNDRREPLGGGRYFPPRRDAAPRRRALQRRYRP